MPIVADLDYETLNVRVTLLDRERGRLSNPEMQKPCLSATFFQSCAA